MSNIEHELRKQNEQALNFVGLCVDVFALGLIAIAEISIRALPCIAVIFSIVYIIVWSSLK